MASASSNRSQKQYVGSKSIETEEIVRYMSHLPSYLERGKPVQDKALNFGVLDWGRLEQWQYHHHHKQSVIAGNRPSLRSHLNIPTEEISSKIKNQPIKKTTTDRSRTKPLVAKNNDLQPQDVVESKSSDDTRSFQTEALSSSSSSSKGKMKIQDEFVNEAVSIQDSSFKTPEEKAFVISSNSSDFKTGTKSRFSFSMSSKLAVPQTLHEDSKVKEKKKIDLGICKEVKADNPCRNKTNVSSPSLPSRKQALFQMAVKNGRPLFTFSVDDNSNDILAATVRSLTKDDANSWAYTFFAIHEVKKKKSGWLFHSAKDKGKGNTYLPNVTAQMKVSNPSVSNGTTREFVLSSVDSGQRDDQTLDVQMENELAAIAVRFLKKAGEDESQDCFGATVILPGGHHSVPRKGEPSPLIERWRSGGGCDCGGWDVGCRLITLVNKVQPYKRSNPPESFDFFLQGDVVDERPFFSLSPINGGIYSVDYNASLPLLHAFSICISVIECRKSSQHTELKTYVAKQVDDDVATVTYASLPPVSPVGRV